MNAEKDNGIIVAKVVIVLKRKYIICILLILSSVLFANWHALVLAYPIFAVCKYLCTVFAISYTTMVSLQVLHVPSVKNEIGKRICMISVTILFLCYFFLTIDTFIFQVLTWYPGILRYALYDAYGIVYLVFILPGIVWHLGSENV